MGGVVGAGVARAGGQVTHGQVARRAGASGTPRLLCCPITVVVSCHHINWSKIGCLLCLCQLPPPGALRPGGTGSQLHPLPKKDHKKTCVLHCFPAPAAPSCIARTRRRAPAVRTADRAQAAGRGGRGSTHRSANGRHRRCAFWGRCRGCFTVLSALLLPSSRPSHLPACMHACMPACLPLPPVHSHLLPMLRPCSPCFPCFACCSPLPMLLLPCGPCWPRCADYGLYWRNKLLKSRAVLTEPPLLHPLRRLRALLAQQAAQAAPGDLCYLP